MRRRPELDLYEERQSMMTPWPRAALSMLLVSLVTLGAAGTAWAQKRAPKITYPKLTKSVRAVYPEAARREGRQGVVILNVTVSETGKVTDVEVFQSAAKDLDEAAMAALRQFEYQPATVDGKPVSAKIRVAYPFKLKAADGSAPARPATPDPRPATRDPRPAIPDPRPATPARPATPDPRPATRDPRPAIPDPRPDAAEAVLARISGRVREKGTRLPVADAEILAFRPVAGQKGPGAAVGSVYASPAGRFALPGLTPGTYVIQVRAAGYLPYAVREKLGAGSRLTVEYFVERRSYDPYETVVRTRTERKEVASYQVTLPEIQKIPGTQGDAIRSVQNMPGVARASFGGGALIVRGASPRDTRVYLEGHEIPQLFHFFGLTSVFNSDILSDIVFVPGNFSVQYGRATGGIIDVYTRAGSRDRWHGYLDIDLWDLGMLVEGPVGKGSIVLAARRSHIDAVLGLLPKDTLGVGLTLAPAYYDYQAMFDYPVLGGKLKIMAFGSDDRVKLLFDSPTGIDLTAKELTSTTLFHRALAAYSRKRDRGELKLSVSTGYQEIDTAISDALQFNLKVLRTNWRAQYAHEVHRTLTVAAGLDGEYSHAWLEFLIPSFGNEGEIPTPIASREKVRGTFSGGVYSQALYLEATWKPTKRLTIVPGLRGDFLKTLTLKGYVFDPRISARYQLPRKLAVTAAVGLFHQEPFFSDLVTSTGGNPSIRHERTMHASAGLAWQAREGLSLELTGFYKHLWRRVAPSSQLIWLEDRVTPENLANHGKGRIYGGELLIKKKPDRDCPRFLKLEKCFGWVSYTLMRSERQDGPGKAWRLFDFDQTHILTIILSGAWKKGWEFGFRFRLASGNPTTVLSGGIYDADTDAYIGIPGTRNAERLPLFHQLDLRVDKKWVFKKWMLSLYLDIQNVYNYRASEFVQYNFNYTQRGYVSGLPIIPSIGIKGEF